MASLQLVIVSFCIFFIRLSHQNDSNITESEDPALFEEGPKCIRPISIGNASQYDTLHVPSYLWPNGTIPYKISKRFDQTQIMLIQEAIFDIENASCVRFVKYNNSSEHEDYVYVRKSHKKGCTADEGRRGGRQNVWLSSECFYAGKGNILHTLLHTAGFLKEHNRPDRDNYLDLVVNGTLNGTGRYYTRRAYGNIFDSCDEYDFYSIMHGVLNFSFENSYFLIKSRQNVTHPQLVGQRLAMSRLNKNKLNRMYNCWNKEEMSIDKVARIKQLETYELLLLLCEGHLNQDFIDLCQWKLAELKFCLPLIKNEPEYPKNKSLT